MSAHQNITTERARAVIAKERQLIGYWDLQRRGRHVPNQMEITLARLRRSLVSLLDAAQHVPMQEARDVLRLVEITHTRLKLKHRL